MMSFMFDQLFFLTVHLLIKDWSDYSQQHWFSQITNQQVRFC